MVWITFFSIDQTCANIFSFSKYKLEAAKRKFSFKVEASWPVFQFDETSLGLLEQVSRNFQENESLFLLQPGH